MGSRRSRSSLRRFFAMLGAGLALMSVGAARAEPKKRVAAAALGDDPMRARALSGLQKGLGDSGRLIRAPAELTAVAGAPLAALASACTGHKACFDGIANSVGSELYLVDIERGQYVTSVSVQQGLPGGGGDRRQRTVYADAEIEAAAYGLAIEVTGTVGEGRVTVTSEPAGADVRIAGRLVGQTPVRGFSAPAGAVRIDIEAKGFEDVSRLLMMAPGGTASVTHQLEAKIDEFVLADLSPAEAPGGPIAGGTDRDGTKLEPTDAARLALPPLAATEIAPPPRRGLRLPTWLAMGFGALAVGGGATFGVHASGKARLARAQSVQLDVQRFNDDARRSALRANIFYAVGAVALGTATYLVVGDLRGP